MTHRSLHDFHSQTNRLVVNSPIIFDVNSLVIPEGKSKVEYSVPYQQSLKVVVSKVSKTFMFRGVYQGKKISKVLGKYPDLTLDQAINIVLTFLAKMKQGINPIAELEHFENVATLSDFFYKTYLPLAKLNKKSWKDDISRFKNHIEPILGAIQLNKITAAMLSDLMLTVKGENRSNATVNRSRALLSSIFNLAFERELIDISPMSRVKKFVEQNHIERYLSEDELKRLMKVLANHAYYGIDNQIIVSIVEMLLLTGARKGEVLNLKWSDLDEVNHLWKLNENKSGKPRIIQLNSQAQQTIRKMSRKYPYVFANPATALPYNDIRKTFQNILQAAQIENFRIHDLRHNFASMAVNNGCDIYVVQHLLGHASPTTTQRYAHLRQDTLRNASEMLAERINEARPNT
ncbi:site-specific recombinase XerD [Acinetobacter calcoaceticus]|uniref:Site-specific recombinase XerD n=1 Tax=Acinetobacter calcoaceticus TaxID=471 RepID=A0A4R1XYR8_ACICA|nr:site-specific recombinase XerD [Acinetobacter calcoaceticus]